jgi:low molecular weight protein-tyrosine phosphatase
MSDAATRFEIVFVCTGNRARSALAEAFLRRRLPPASATVRSVGTLQLGQDVPALAAAVRAAAVLGEDLTAHRSRALRTGELADADLVIGFEPAHVSAAVIDGGAARDRTFSIIELVELLDRLRTEGAGDAHPSRVVELAHARRQPSFLAAASVADPLGGSDEDFRKTAEQIVRLIDAIAHGLFGSTAHSAIWQPELERRG